LFPQVSPRGSHLQPTTFTIRHFSTLADVHTPLSPKHNCPIHLISSYPFSPPCKQRQSCAHVGDSKYPVYDTIVSSIAAANCLPVTRHEIRPEVGTRLGAAMEPTYVTNPPFFATPLANVQFNLHHHNTVPAGRLSLGLARHATTANTTAMS
jgi:hypothetical protein